MAGPDECETERDLAEKDVKIIAREDWVVEHWTREVRQKTWGVPTAQHRLSERVATSKQLRARDQ